MDGNGMPTEGSPPGRDERSGAGWQALRASVRALVARKVAPSDVDDVVQDVLLAVGASKSPAARSPAYVLGVARRLSHDHHRRRAREHARLARLSLEPDDRGGDDDELEALVASALTMFLPAVSERYRQALEQVDLRGRSQAEVARELGIPLSTLRTRVQRGRAELRAQLEACCAIETDVRGRVTSCEPRATSDCALC